MRFKREDYNYMAGLRRSAFVKIAQELGPTHKVTHLMGCMSYGRNSAEQGPGGNLQSAVREMSFLDGCFEILNVFCRDSYPEAQRVLLKHWPRGYTTFPSNSRNRA